MARALINVPKTAKRGQVIEIKTLISHIMETGFRRYDVGQPIPRDIITNFVCTYNGEEIFRAELYPAISAIHSSPSSQLRQITVRLCSNGMATTDFESQRPQ